MSHSNNLLIRIVDAQMLVSINFVPTVTLVQLSVIIVDHSYMASGIRVSSAMVLFLQSHLIKSGTFKLKHIKLKYT